MAARVMMRKFILVSIIMAMLGASAWGYKVDTNGLYFGDPKKFTKPATIIMEKVLDACPPFQEIKREKISSDSAKYWILIHATNIAIEKAFRKVNEEMGIDLIVEKGFIEKEDEKEKDVPDITDIVIKYLK